VEVVVVVVVVVAAAYCSLCRFRFTLQQRWYPENLRSVSLFRSPAANPSSDTKAVTQVANEYRQARI